MSGARVAMKWVDEDGSERKLFASGAARLKYVAGRSSATGRFQLPADQRAWAAREVRSFELLGLWEVTWLEEGDLSHEGAWRIEGLTTKGGRVLEQWQRLVEQGEGTKGPQRQSVPPGK